MSLSPCPGAAGLSPNCSTAEAACETGVCLNGGTCTLSAAADHFNCTCAPGYKGNTSRKTNKKNIIYEKGYVVSIL